MARKDEWSAVPEKSIEELKAKQLMQEAKIKELETENKEKDQEIEVKDQEISRLKLETVGLIKDKEIEKLEKDAGKKMIEELNAKLKAKEKDIETLKTEKECLSKKSKGIGQWGLERLVLVIECVRVSSVIELSAHALYKLTTGDIWVVHSGRRSVNPDLQQGYPQET